MCCGKQSCYEMENEVRSRKRIGTTDLHIQSASIDLEPISGCCGTSQDCDDFSHVGKLGMTVVL